MPDIDFTKLPPFHSSEEILAHPRFSMARDEFVKAMPARYKHKPFLNRLLLVGAALRIDFDVVTFGGEQAGQLSPRTGAAERWPMLRRFRLSN
jgi:hypothetical protein